MRTAWNDAEDEALQGLSSDAQIIYLRGLRRYMDFGTGVAGGSKRRVNYQSLVEVITPCPDWGSTTARKPPPTKAYVRARITELKRAGMIVDAGSNKQIGLVVRLLLADTVSVYPEKERHRNDTGRQHREQHRNDTGNNKNNQQLNNESEPRNDTGSSTPDITRNDTHQVSGKELYCTARAEPDRIPQKPQEWASWFSAMGLFAHHQVQNASTIPLFADWCKRGISIETVSHAMDAAHAHLGSQPDTPKYYKGFVKQILTEQQRLQSETDHEQPRHRAGSQGGSAKLSAVERASRAADEYIASLSDEADASGHG